MSVPVKNAVFMGGELFLRVAKTHSQFSSCEMHPIQFEQTYTLVELQQEGGWHLVKCYKLRGKGHWVQRACA
eukprot:8704880-Pyramimonas_sp.AAC.1